MNPRPSPYVGPRSFRRGETIYGRKKEIRDLLHLLIAERIVLLYSPSGAGKSSLIQAGLAPALERKGFIILPTVRVNLLPPHGVAANRYLYSTLAALEEGRPAGEQLPVEQLAALDLQQYLDLRVPAEDDIVLIFDQFEELLTADPTDLEAKLAFTRQLGAALERRRLWALVALREDYVGALDPYIGPIPNRFHERFRLGLLGTAAAQQAIVEPARAAGVAFDDSAAQHLIDDLRLVQVQRPDGTTAPEPGPYVEPVQLQVVCLRLWQRLAADDTHIDDADVAAVGDVDSSLAEYYTAKLAELCADGALGVRERAVRDWFDTRLITERGIRAQVVQEPGATQGLDNRAIRRLIDAHLVRAEPRRGATWYELTHDRLIAPIRRDNAAWREAHLSQLQIQSALWERQGRPDGLLLRGPELAAAEQWAAANRDELTDIDAALLNASREERDRQRREARAQRRIRRLAVVASVVGALAMVLAVAALSLYGIAEGQKRAALNQALAADSLALLASGDTDEALALALAGVAVAEPDPAADLALALAADAAGARRVIAAHEGIVNDVVVAADGRSVISAGSDGSIIRWDVVTGAELGRLARHEGGVEMLALSPDGTTLLSASGDGTARLWDLAAWREREVIEGGGPLVSVAFSPDGALIAYGGRSVGVRVRALAGGPVLREIAGAETMAFTPDGEAVVVGGSDGLIRRVAIDDGDELARYEGHTRVVRNIAVSPDGALIASGSQDSSVRLWDLASGRQRWRSVGHTATVWSVAFGPGEAPAQVLSTSSDGSMRLWNIETGAEARAFLGHSSAVHSAAFSPDGALIASASEDGSLRLWAAGNHQERLEVAGVGAAAYTVVPGPDGASAFVSSIDGSVRKIALGTGRELLRFVGHEGPVFAAAISPDGRLLATGSGNPEHSIRLWDAASARMLVEIAGPSQPVQTLAFSADGALLYSGDDAGAIRVWRSDGGAEAGTPLLSGGDPITKLLLSADGRTLFSGGDDSAVRIWDLASGAETGRLVGHSGGVLDLALSPDGATLASAANDRSVQLWRLSDRSRQLRISGHKGAVWGVSFSPDGATLATGSTDRSVRLWRIADGQELRRYTGHLDRIWDAAFSVDGRSILSTADDGTLRVWAIETRDELVGWAKAQRYVPELTCEQRARYQIGAGCER